MAERVSRLCREAADAIFAFAARKVKLPAKATTLAEWLGERKTPARKRK